MQHVSFIAACLFIWMCCEYMQHVSVIAACFFIWMCCVYLQHVSVIAACFFIWMCCVYLQHVSVFAACLFIWMCCEYLQHVSVFKKGHWEIDESEHNTDCEVTVVITNSYAPNICIYPLMFYRPAASRIIRSSAGIVKKQARTTAKIANHGNKCNVPGCAGDVKCRCGLVSVLRKAQIANNSF